MPAPICVKSVTAVPLHCPSCTREYPAFSPVCPHCGTDLGYLIEHPARIRLAIWLAMWLGLALSGMVLWHLLAQVLDGRAPVFGRLDALLLGGGLFFSVLGARAWRWLKRIVRARLLAARHRDPPRAQEETEPTPRG